VVLGDANTAYFHRWANNRRRKTRITSLEFDGNITRDIKMIEDNIEPFLL
jgi:hypothetical protein